MSVESITKKEMDAYIYLTQYVKDNPDIDDKTFSLVAEKVYNDARTRTYDIFSLDRFLQEKMSINTSSICCMIDKLSAIDKDVQTTDYITIHPSADLVYPVMYGYDNAKRFFLCIKYTVEDTNTPRLATVFQRYSDDSHTFVSSDHMIFPLCYMSDAYFSDLRNLLVKGKFVRDGRTFVLL